MGNHWAKRHIYMGTGDKVEKRAAGGSRKGIPNKATKDVREAIARFARANVENLGAWLDRVAADDPGKAIDLYLRAIEYHLPKMRQLDINGAGGATINILAILDRAKQTGLDGLLAQSEPVYIEHDPSRFAEAEASYQKERQAKLEQELSAPFDPLAFEPDAE